jgi:muramoyltetrapeptide carboxypeptidase
MEPVRRDPVTLCAMSVLRPPALRPGDTVMLVSPSGPSRAERVARGIELLSGWGLTVAPGPDVYARHGFFGGTDEQRLAGLNAALRDPAVRGVVCTRGGYGAQRVADGIDVGAVRADPKVLVGFSDITALQLALWRGARLATVHGPGAAWLDDRTPASSADSLRHVLMSDSPVPVAADPGAETGPVVVPGPAVTGTLLGGNLCLLASSVGTPDFPDLHGAVLLLEEVDEPPYKVDRMLTHLRRAGVLAGLAGIAVGQFTRCADAWPVTVAQVLTERLGGLGVPVLGGLPVGHGYGQVTVPVGVPATLDVAAGTLTVSPAVYQAT